MKKYTLCLVATLAVLLTWTYCFYLLAHRNDGAEETLSEICVTDTNSIYGGGYVDTRFINKTRTQSKTYILSRSSFEKFCVQQGIPSDINIWYNTSFTDYETGKNIPQRVITKDDNKKDDFISDVYRLQLKIEENDTSFVILYRKTYLVK